MTADKKNIREGDEVECFLTSNLLTIKNSHELSKIKSEIKNEKTAGDGCCNLKHMSSKQTLQHVFSKKFSMGYIIVSDRASKGEYKDESGPALEDFFANLYDHKSYDLKEKIVIPDEKDQIEKMLIDLVDNKKLDLIFTSGGTGLTNRDVTPEATLNILDKEATGISNYIMNESLKITKMACLSRAVAGIRKNTLIINLPGSPKAVKENLNILHPILKHALNQICQEKDFH